MIGAALLLPLLLGGGFGLLGARLARRLPPREATWLVSAGGLVVGLCTVASLGMLAFTFLAEVPGVAARGHWSPVVVRSDSHIPPGVACASFTALALLLTAATVVCVSRCRALGCAYRTCRELPPGVDGMVVTESDTAEAYAVPGRPGRIVVSRGLLQELPAPQLRALLAHEQAHLTHYHHWYKLVVAIAVALNPLLSPLAGAVDLSVERWADEDAAVQVGSRARLAAALGRAALLPRGRASQPAAALGAADHVSTRMRAMLGPPPSRRRGLVVVGVMAVVLTAVATANAGLRLDHVIDDAGYAAAAPVAGP